MDKFKYIIDLFEQDEISDIDKENLDRLSSEDIEIKNFIDIYSKLENIFNSSGHLDQDILAEFILYYDGDLDVASYIPQLTEKIEDHLSNCSTCNKEYISLTKEYQEVDDFVSKSIRREIEEDIEYEKPPSIVTRIKRSNYKTFLVAIILLAITYSGMMLTSSYTTPFYKVDIFDFPELTDSSQFIRSTEEFQKGLISIKREEYDKAIDHLLDDIIIDTIPNTVFISHFMLGLVYFKSAESIFLGTFKSYSRIRVNEGIENLLITINKNNSGEYDSLNSSAHYYIAKGYLAIDDIESAKNYLRIVARKKGKFHEDALVILRAFEKVD